MKIDQYIKLAGNSAKWSLILDEAGLEASDGYLLSIRSYFYSGKKDVLVSKISITKDNSSITEYRLSRTHSNNEIFEGGDAQKVYDLVEAGKTAN
ncbi:MAG: hypothetical protein HY831_02230 [Candidatus Aenigmarchaeota archaeon]|nr:hypothetical protein [Candidatus Aenigmarchaeota archaeon]